MSRSDYPHEIDTVMADAFRKAGLARFSVQTRRDHRKARTHPSPRPAGVSTYWRASLIATGSGNRPQLDLHGYTEDRAYEWLKAFIGACHRERFHEVLVITGKGSGKLKRLVPLWLEARPFEAFVVSARVADPWDGGDGALYVRLHTG